VTIDGNNEIRSAGDDLTAARQELIEEGGYLARCGFHAALAGNLSARVGENRLLCTSSGADKSALKLSDLVLCDLSGTVIEGEGKPTSELSMHLMAYRERPNVGAVIHAHPPTATAFAAVSLPLDVLALPEMVVLIGPIALVPYATPGTEELARQLQKYLPTHDGFLLENHGALSVGKDLRQACQRMDLIEQNARVTLAVRQLGKPFQLDPQQLQALLEIRSKRAAMLE
jgi:L-fuculose-phosphate aldolase